MARRNMLMWALRYGRGPLLVDVQNILNGPSHTFFVEESSGWRGIEIERLLVRHGIRIWGEMIVAGDIMFTVRRAQARWAQYLLERAGVPIKDGFAFCASTQTATPRTPATVWARLSGMWEDLMDELGF